MRWHIKNGRRWMVQWGRPIFFSLGVHIDADLQYVDLHLIFVIVTIGNPNWTYDEYNNAHRAWWSSRSKQ